MPSLELIEVGLLGKYAERSLYLISPSQGAAVRVKCRSNA